MYYAYFNACGPGEFRIRVAGSPGAADTDVVHWGLRVLMGRRAPAFPANRRTASVRPTSMAAAEPG